MKKVLKSFVLSVLVLLASVAIAQENWPGGAEREPDGLGPAAGPHLGHVQAGSDGQDDGTVSRRRSRLFPGILPIPASQSEFRNTP